MESKDYSQQCASIDTSLDDLISYCQASERYPTHIKLAYDVEEKRVKLTAQLRDDALKLAYSQKLKNETQKLQKLVDKYVSFYHRPFLKKVFVDTAIDSWGVNSDTLQVVCRFKPDLNNGIHPNIIIKQILAETNMAEARNRSVTVISCTMHFKARMLENLDLIFNNQNLQKTVYCQEFGSDFINAMTALVTDFKSDGRYSDTKLSFNLLQRDKLIFQNGKITANVDLLLHNGHFASEDAAEVLRQLNQTLLSVPHARIASLRMDEQKSWTKAIYRPTFQLLGGTEAIAYQFDITNELSNGMANLFTQAVKTYSLPKTVDSAWQNHVLMSLTTQQDEWNVRFKDYYLTRNYPKPVNVGNLQEAVDTIENLVGDGGLISSFSWTSQHGETTGLTCHVNLDTLQYMDVPMNMQNIFQNNGDAQITRYFQLNGQQYYLVKEQYEKESAASNSAL